ncbi:hypothetical protein ADICYQ_1647 [Cyclobacterium qasimii M12-11B]|uniref:Uncharacterized protein n=1 Tax=Cyclobacterium qasimii M12-11B TaxID=641524 RepID=S7VGG7_9BACT|nr:hypothetical protein ADICYQ_1647 [Cyclobacterium qasimii M12-11B]
MSLPKVLNRKTYPKPGLFANAIAVPTIMRLAPNESPQLSFKKSNVFFYTLPRRR